LDTDAESWVSGASVRRSEQNVSTAADAAEGEYKITLLIRDTSDKGEKFIAIGQLPSDRQRFAYVFHASTSSPGGDKSRTRIVTSTPLRLTAMMMESKVNWLSITRTQIDDANNGFMLADDERAEVGVVRHHHATLARSK
jgi:hypothetical protein